MRSASKPLLVIFTILFATDVFADIVVSRKAFPFTQEGKEIPHYVYAEEHANPAVREAQLLQGMTREINAGFMNLIGVETVYKDGYLTQVKIIRLDKDGLGNRIRVAVVTKTQPKGIFEDTVERYLYAVNEIPRQDLLAAATIVDQSVSSDTAVAKEVFYREPSDKAGLQRTVFAAPKK